MAEKMETVLRRLEEEEGTPFYLLDLDKLGSRVDDLKSWMGGGIGLCFAIKSNPFLAAHLARITDRLEVCSFGEYKICRTEGIAPEKLLISGVLKKEKELEEILEECGGRRRYTVESPAQYEILARWSREHSCHLSVYPRLTSGNQFGMDQETVKKICLAAKEEPCLEISGIHFFSGTQKSRTKKLLGEVEKLDAFLQDLERETGKVPELEFGTGMAFSYFQDQKPVGREFMEEVCGAIRSMQWSGHVTIEMGRAIAASCGCYVTKASDIKESDGRAYCIVDGGIHQLHYDGQIRGMYHPFLKVLPAEGDFREPSGKTWTICGSLCTVNDVLVAEQELGELSLGDLLVFENAGAYSMLEGMALFLSHEIPGIAVYSREKGARWLRRSQESWPMNCCRAEKESLALDKSDHA